MVSVYSILSIFKHWHFSTGFDLGLNDQVVWHYSRFEAPIVTTCPFLSNFLGAHFDPLVACLAPLYWILPKVEVLLAAQSFLLVLPIFPIFAFVNKRLGRLAGYLFAISYSIFWGIQTAATFEFHEVSLAVPLASFAVYFMDEEKWMPFLLSSSLLMFVKEDMCLLAMFLGFAAILKKQFKIGVFLAAASFSMFIIELKVIIPYFADTGKYPYWSSLYSELGSGPLEGLKICMTHPIRIFLLLFSDPRKIKTLICIFGPFLMAPFFSTYGILLIPLICERMLSSNIANWVVNNESHYTAVISPIVILAAADGFFNVFKKTKDSKKKSRYFQISGIIVLILNFSLSGLSRFPLRWLITPAFYKLTDNQLEGPKILSMIPKDAGVMCQDVLVPHLTHRKIVREILGDDMSGNDVDYVIACSSFSPFPSATFQDIQARLNIMEEKGYQKIYDKNGWIILKKES